MTTRKLLGVWQLISNGGSPMVKVRQRGSGYSGKDSTKSAQQQESDITNFGGTAPGGLTAFIGGSSQWSTPNALKGMHNIPPGGIINPVMHAAAVMHVGLKDEAPNARGAVPIHPGLAPGLTRTASDANPRSPDGEAPVNYSPTETGGHPLAPNGRHRGESPEIPKQSRGAYRN